MAGSKLKWAWCRTVVGLCAVLLALGMAVSTSAQMITEKQIAEKREHYKEQLLKMTAVDFQRTAQVDDDDLSNIATIDTKRGFWTTGGIFDIQGADVYLRAHIDKQTGAVSVQIYASLWYTEPDQRRYTIVNYQDGDKVSTAELTTLRSELVGCQNKYGVLECRRAEDVVFPVPEKLLWRIAGAPANQFWRFKLRAQAGTDWEDMIAPAEASGLLTAIGVYKARHTLP